MTKRLNDKVARCILGKSKSIGFVIHFAEIFPDELTKVSPNLGIGAIGTIGIIEVAEEGALRTDENISV